MESILNSDMLNMIFDGVLVIAIIGLWVMWYQQAGQRKKVEGLLLEASRDLQAATTLLNQVMTEMPKLKETFQAGAVREAAQKSQAKHQPIPQPTPDKHAVKAVQKAAHKDQVSISKRVDKLKKVSSKKGIQDSNFAAQIMRLNREGLSMNGIAKHLGLPVAQVRLMLLLQSSKA